MSKTTTTLSFDGIDLRETLESTVTSIGVLCIGFALGAYYLGNQILAECGFKSTQVSGAGVCTYAIEATNSTTRYGALLGVALFLVGVALTTRRGESG